MPRRDASRSRRSTIQDVARLAGVSVGTVSRVANANPTVDPALRGKVQVAIRSLAYRPSAVAQSMRTAETRLIGCLLSDIGNPLYAAVLRSAETVLAPAGYTLLVASTDDVIAREIALVALFASRRVDALVAVPSRERNPKLLAALRDAAVPLVMMEREMALPADSIATDHHGSMREATAHLLALGHRRIALVTGSLETRSGRDRVGGYQAALAEQGVAYNAALVRGHSLSSDYAFAETRRWFVGRNRPTAVIAGGDRLLTGVLRALASLGRAVPEEASVISSGDTELAELAAPSITVTRWDLAAFGRTLAEMLLARLRDRDAPPRSMVLPTELVVRQSTAPRPG